LDRRRRQRRQAGVGAKAGVLAVAQRAGGLLDRLVLAQPLDQVGRVLDLLALGRPRRARQQDGRLDQQQLGRDGDEVGQVVRVDRLERVDVGQVEVGDPGQRDGRDVELAPLGQLEQQIERAVEATEREPEALAGGRTLVGQGVARAQCVWTPVLTDPCFSPRSIVCSRSRTAFGSRASASR
jgi:hypothetical protein